MSRIRIILTIFIAMLTFSLPYHIQTSLHSSLAISPFRLPIASGLTVTVSQGNNDTQHDHVGKAAWAFDFIVATTNFIVTAAQGGTVIGADDSSTIGCNDVGCWTQANYLLIADDDGKTATLYLHLLHNSLKVNPGMHVNQGDPLGLADTTGWATGPHLHFQVENVPSSAAQHQQYPGWWWTKSVPVSFSNPEVLSQDANGVPQEGQSFLVSNPPAPTPTSITTPSIPVPVPTPTQSSTLLYSADWSNGLNGWTGSQEWSASNGELQSDGTDGNGHLDLDAISPHYRPSTANYAVEAKMQIVNSVYGLGQCYVGIRGRVQNPSTSPSYVGDGYFLGFDGGYNAAMIAYESLSNAPNAGFDVLQSQNFDPSFEWHTYRAEFKGNQITLLIDGKLMAQVTNNSLPTTGILQLEDGFCPVHVSSFQVFSL